MTHFRLPKAPGQQNQTGIDVTVAIFFDGTNNNRNNTAQRHIVEHNQKFPDQPINQEDGIAYSGSYEQHGVDKQGQPKDNSYAAGYSNVSILERMNIKRRLAEHDISLYIEGIGTQNDEDDQTLLGSGLGIGPTGIKVKVSQAVGRLGRDLGEILTQQKDSYLEHLTLDVFGFSRGAAARHFISLINDPKHPLAARLGTPRAKLKVKFVGLFDTVSSRGASLLIGHGDVRSLGLALGTDLEKVVQLTAGNEYRKNFSLTDIGSSLSKGYELTLPGAHSNIGGGYGETEDETRALHPAQVPTLLAQGWYAPEQVRQGPRPPRPDAPPGPPRGGRARAQGRRQGLSADYQFIPCACWPTTPGARQGAVLSVSLSPITGSPRTRQTGGQHDHCRDEALERAQRGSQVSQGPPRGQPGAAAAARAWAAAT